jgi:hypothetical protein
LLLLVLLTIVIFQIRHLYGAHSQHACHRFHQNICRGTRTQKCALAPSAHPTAVLEEQSKDGASRYFSVNAAHGDEFFCATGMADAKENFVCKT